MEEGDGHEYAIGKVRWASGMLVVLGLLVLGMVIRCSIYNYMFKVRYILCTLFFMEVIFHNLKK